MGKKTTGFCFITESESTPEVVQLMFNNKYSLKNL